MMTPNETKRVLTWLRARGEPYPGGENASRERRTLQRALRKGEPISREIRDAMADWLESDDFSLLINPAGEMYYGWQDKVHIPEDKP